jgi:hypothetical protein
MPEKGSGQEGRMADGRSRPVGIIAPAPREVRRTGSLTLLARHKASVALMHCLPLMVIVTFLTEYHMAGLTTGATKF